MEKIVSDLRALADPTRLRLLNLLSYNKEICVCDLEHVIGTGQPKISRHLAYLKNAAWVEYRRERTWAFYSLRHDLSPTASRVLEALRGEWEQSEPFRSDRQRLEALIREGSCRLATVLSAPTSIRGSVAG